MLIPGGANRDARRFRDQGGVLAQAYRVPVYPSSLLRLGSSTNVSNS